MVRVALKIAGAFVAAIAVGALAIVAVQYRRNDRPIVLPRPRGPHRVGRVLVTWKDTKRNRELMVFLWYPAAAGAVGPPPAQGRMPVLVLLPGLGRVPAHYTTMAEDLASFGYIIVGVTPTGGGRPSQKLVETWAADAAFALDQLEHDPLLGSHADGNRIGIFGHSFGGNVALHAIANDGRLRRAANLDGSLFGDPIGHPRKPLLILCASAIDPEWRSICASGEASCAAFPNALHMNFSDVGVLPSRFPLPRSLLELGSVDGRQFLRDVVDRLRAFFGPM